MSAFSRAAVLMFSVLTLGACGQSRVCIGGDLEHLTLSERRTCQASANRIMDQAARLHAPGDWHFFVICTDADWTRYAAFSTHSALELATLSVDTDLARRTTFFRGARLAKVSPAGADGMVTHEIAKAVEQSSDEDVIQGRLAVWRTEERKDETELRASR